MRGSLELPGRQLPGELVLVEDPGLTPGTSTPPAAADRWAGTILAWHLSLPVLDAPGGTFGIETTSAPLFGLPFPLNLLVALQALLIAQRSPSGWAGGCRSWLCDVLLCGRLCLRASRRLFRVAHVL